MTAIETIQTAVCVLLELREVRSIVLITIIIKRPENSSTQIVIGKNEAPKIRNEWLNPDTRRNKIKVLIHILELHFGEGFFQRKLRVGAISPPAHVDIYHAGLARIEVIRETKGRRDLDRPVARLVSRIAVEHLERELKYLVDGERFRLAKKFGAARTRAADVRW